MFNQAAYSDSENPANTRLFDTGWSGVLTFEEIMHDITPLVRSNCYRFQPGLTEADFEDMLQRGLLVLWQRLQTEPRLLAQATKYTATMLVCANRGHSYQERVLRELPLSQLVPERQWDEFLLGGWERDRAEVWAAWATRADLRMDIERILGELSTAYLREPHAQRYLTALYYLTTSVELQYLPLLSGVAEATLRPFIREVRQDLQTAFAAIYDLSAGWWDKYQQGNQRGAHEALARYAHHAQIQQAIHWLLAGSPAAQRGSLELWHITRARRTLERAYHTNH